MPADRTDVTQLIAEARDAAAREHFKQCREIDTLRSQLSEREARVAELEGEVKAAEAAINGEAYNALHDGFAAGRSRRTWEEVSKSWLDANVPLTPAKAEGEKT